MFFVVDLASKSWTYVSSWLIRVYHYFTLWFFFWKLVGESKCQLFSSICVYNQIVFVCDIKSHNKKTVMVTKEWLSKIDEPIFVYGAASSSQYFITWPYIVCLKLYTKCLPKTFSIKYKVSFYSKEIFYGKTILYRLYII